MLWVVAKEGGPPCSVRESNARPWRYKHHALPTVLTEPVHRATRVALGGQDILHGSDEREKLIPTFYFCRLVGR